MDGDWFAEPGRRPGVATCPLQHTGIKWPALVLTRKHPMPRPCFTPIGAQHDEELWRQHDVTIAAAFALLGPDQHTPAVDVGNREPHHFRHPESRGIGGHQRGTMLQAWHRREKPRHLISAEDY